jgi:hypothetical protein
VNGVALTKIGLRNVPKLKTSGQFPKGPKTKNCGDCGESMDYRTTGQIQKSKNNGPYYYQKNHNGKCQKNNISIVVKEKVNSGKRCHNPRCSAVNPTYIWDVNQKLYCSVQCIDGYQDWHDAAAKEVGVIYSISPTHFHPEIGSMVGGHHYYFKELC